MDPPSRNRGITASDVDRAADTLLRAGERPTIEKVRQRIGRGSPNTINPLLDAWWSRLAGRLDAGPAALHRLPEPVLLAAEGLWLQALDEARRRAAVEQGSTRKALARERQDLEVRSHVLSIREAELTSLLEQRERRIARLELELQTLATLLRKEQAVRARQPRRGRATQPTAARRRQQPKSLKPARNASRAPRTARAKVPSKRQRRR